MAGRSTREEFYGALSDLEMILEGVELEQDVEEEVIKAFNDVNYFLNMYEDEFNDTIKELEEANGELENQVIDLTDEANSLSEELDEIKSWY